jgi:hypothetical protein
LRAARRQAARAARYFLCRHCYRLAHASQSESGWDRALRRANKIRQRLGGEPGMAATFPKKPKGMHRRTYDRLQEKVYEAEMLANERLAFIVARLNNAETEPIGLRALDLTRSSGNPKPLEPTQAALPNGAK